MQKVIITKSGKACYMSGPGVRNITITAYDDKGNIDTVEEEIEIVAGPEETERLRKINTVKGWRGKQVRRLYKRGEKPALDKIRDRNAGLSVRLPDERR